MMCGVYVGVCPLVRILLGNKKWREEGKGEGGKKGVSWQAGVEIGERI